MSFDPQPGGNLTVSESGVAAGVRPQLNLIEGGGIDIALADDPGNNRVNATLTVTGSGGPPSGAAGGDLAGTYPNPTVGANKITNAKLAQMVARTLKGNGTNATADPQDLAGAGAGTVPIDTGSGVGFAVLTRILQNISFEGDITPTQITADQNNYSPANLGTAFIVRISTDASRNITGLVPGTADGDAKLVINVGSFDFTLVSESASSTATNRFTGGDLTIRANECALLVHDPTTDRWRAVARSHRPLAGNATITVSGDAISVNLGTTATSACAGNDSRLSDSRAPTGAAGGSLSGTYPNPGIAAGAVGGTEIAASIKDPAAGTAGLRTLSNTGTTACAGNDSRLSDSRAPTGAAGGDLAGTYPNPTIGSGKVVETKLATVIGNVVFTLTDAATIVVNRDNGKNQTVVLGGNRTMGIPSGALADGMFLIFAIRQDGTGSRTITFATGTGGFRATGGCSLTPTLSTGAGKLDWVVARYDATDNKWDLVQLTLAA